MPPPTSSYSSPAIAAAERLYRESLATFGDEQLGDRREVAVTLHNLALMRREQGRAEEALKLLARSRDTFAALGLEKDVATVEKTIAEIEHGAQDTNKLDV
ncbi:MAG: tetratricopeptide repeat protein [Chloroflexota bacterium]|nr:tetratricopeptide repeat protein [Chloroflexota bacterium]